MTTNKKQTLNDRAMKAVALMMDNRSQPLVEIVHEVLVELAEDCAKILDKRKREAEEVGNLAQAYVMGYVADEIRALADPEGKDGQAVAIGKYEAIPGNDGRWHLFLDGRCMERSYARLTDARRAVKNQSRNPEKTDAD